MYPKSVSVLKIHFNVAISLMILLVFENLSLILHCHCRLYTDNGSAARSRALHNVKASSMLCSGLSETWEISNCSSGTLLEMNATGMYVKTYTGVCSEGISYTLGTLSWKRVTYWRRLTFHTFNYKGTFSQPQKRTSGNESLRFFCVVDWAKNFYA